MIDLYTTHYKGYTVQVFFSLFSLSVKVVVLSGNNIVIQDDYGNMPYLLALRKMCATL